MHLVFGLVLLIKVYFCFLNIPYYQNTFQVLSSPGLEPTTLCSSAQSPTTWASTTTLTNRRCRVKRPYMVIWSRDQSACGTHLISSPVFQALTCGSGVWDVVVQVAPHQSPCRGPAHPPSRHHLRLSDALARLTQTQHVSYI